MGRRGSDVGLMPTRFTIEVTGLDRVQQNFDRADLIIRGAINRTMRRIGKLMVPVLKGVTPRVTGKLKNSTIFQILGAPDTQVLQIRQGARSVEGAFYGEFVRKGTAPHVIVPRRAKALRFMIGGNVVFARRVNHPGTAANPYHTRALSSARSRINGIIAEEQEAAAAEFTR